MSKTYSPIMFFSDEITIKPHTCTKADYLDRPVSIREFANAAPVTLDRCLDTDEFFVRNPVTLEFMEGPEMGSDYYQSLNQEEK